MKSNADKGRRRHHPAWNILIACCCLYGATAGMINNCRGLFYAAAARELGVSATVYANYLTFGSIAGVLTVPLLSRLFKKLPIKLILIAILGLLGASTAALGAVKTLAQCYVVGALQGVVCSFSANYPAAYLVKQWFSEKKGLAMGIATASAGAVGSVMNVLLDYGLRTIGWRATYGVLGLCSFLLGAIPTLLLVRRSPAELGMRPYGATEAAADLAQPAASAASGARPRLCARELKLFLPIALMHATCSLSSAYLQHVPTFAHSIGLATTAGTRAIAIAMLTGIAAKLLYGLLSDRIGIFRTAALMTASVAASFLLLITMRGNAALLTALGITMGPLFALIAVQAPMLLDRFYRGSSYDTLLAALVTIATLFSAGGNVLVNLFYRLGGQSYRLGHVIMLGLLVICIFLYYVLQRIDAQNADARKGGLVR